LIVIEAVKIDKVTRTSTKRGTEFPEPAIHRRGRKESITKSVKRTAEAVSIQGRPFSRPLVNGLKSLRS
jgi:hypothetical protein